jgi:hypothetical protein
MIARATTVTVEDVPNEIIPLGGYVHVVANRSDANRFWHRNAVGLQSMSSTPAETIAEFIAAFGNEGSFSPVPWGSYNIGSAPLPLHALWARVPIALTGPRPRCPAPDVDPASEAHARLRISDAGLVPSFVINEGDALVGLWKLTAPLADLALARRLLVQLASRVGGDRSMADFASALVRLPGSRNTNVFPARDVVIETWAPERVYELGRVEEMLSWSPRW